MKRPQTPDRGISGRRSGLTLVEMLITTIILSFLGAVIYSTFSQGMKLWHRAAKDHPEMDVELFFEKLTHDLRNAITSENAHFKGERDRVDFFMQAPPQELGPSGKGAISVPAAVHYMFEKNKKAVTKSQKSLKQILSPLLAAKTTGERTLVRQVTRCSLEYYDFDKRDQTYRWKDRWDKACLPLGVKIDMGYQMGTSVKQYSRMVPILAGGCPAETP